MVKRIIFDLLLLGAIFYTPWWVAALLAFVCVFLIPRYYEILVFGLLVDLLYGTSVSTLYGMVGTVGAVALFFTGEFAKKIVRPTYPLPSR